MDALLALTVVTILLTGLLIAVAHQRKVERVLQGQRSAYHHLEDAANALLSGQPLPAGARLEALPAPEGATTPAGRTWTRITVGRASLVTLAPQSAIAPATAPATTAPATIAPASAPSGGSP